MKFNFCRHLPISESLQKLIFIKIFRQVSLDLVVEKEILVTNIKTLEEAVAGFLSLCFIANLKYPDGSGVLCTVLQRCVAKLDEHGTTATMSKKSLVSKNDGGKCFNAAWAAYCTGLGKIMVTEDHTK
jgi:hypothetical protein